MPRPILGKQGPARIGMESILLMTVYAGAVIVHFLSGT